MAPWAGQTESPDFIVTEGVVKFGLEVVEIFTGPQDEHGARKRKAESDTQKAVNVLREEYEKKDSTPLIVKFVGDMCRENVEEVILELQKLNLSDASYGHQECFKVDEGAA